MIKLLILAAVVLGAGYFFGGYFFDLIGLGSNENDSSPDNKNYNVDYTCSDDDDCYLTVPSKVLECLPCDPLGCKSYDSADRAVDSVSVNWNPGCPTKDPDSLCLACIGGINGNYKAKCVENKCEKVLI